MSVISDVGSLEYYELRAIEEIHAARNIRDNIDTDSSGDYRRHIDKAIQLLLLARLHGTA